MARAFSTMSRSRSKSRQKRRAPPFRWSRSSSIRRETRGGRTYGEKKSRRRIERALGVGGRRDARGARREELRVDRLDLRVAVERLRHDPAPVGRSSSSPANQKQVCPRRSRTRSHFAASSETPSVPARRVETKPMRPSLAGQRSVSGDRRARGPSPSSARHRRRPAIAVGGARREAGISSTEHAAPPTIDRRPRPAASGHASRRAPMTMTSASIVSAAARMSVAPSPWRSSEAVRIPARRSTRTRRPCGGPSVAAAARSPGASPLTPARAAARGRRPASGAG